MIDVAKWPWSQSLALARKGEVVEVKKILFGTVRDFLWEAGVREGATLEYLEKDDDGVRVRLGDGRGVMVHRDHSWFIVVASGGHPSTKQE